LRHHKSNRLVGVGAYALVVIVALISFGEMVRRGDLHLDHGRGFDLPAPVSLDSAHPQLSTARLPRIATNVVQHAVSIERFAVLPKVHPVIVDAAWLWLGLRPPPQA
jgi:hypothetical protein